MDQPRPPTRARLSASKMVYPLVAAFLSLSLLFSGSVGLKWQLKEGRKVGQSLCPSYPYPTVDPSTLLKILGPFLEELGQNMSSLIKSTPGGAVVSVVYRDTVIWTHADGLINMSDPTRGRPTADTGFRIGSITKVFAAIMSLMLRDSGELRSLDDNITNYLPQFRIKNPFQTSRGITFRQLSSHMSGLPRNPPCPGVFDTGCNLTDDQIYENLSKMKLMFPPGFQPEYSNLGFGLLGRVLQTIRGPPWEEQVAQMVFKPLNMTNSGNSFTPDVVKNMAVGYYQDGTIAKLIDIGWDAPAGQMYSSASDLSQLLKLIFRPEYPYNIDTEQILDGETIREWMQPAYTYADGTGFGHPWELLQLGNFILRTKAGVMNGYNAELQFAEPCCDSCSSHEPIIELSQKIILTVSEILETLQPGPSVPPSPPDYTGKYSIGAQGPTVAVVELGTVYDRKALLLLDSSGERSILDWRGEDEFQISLHGGPQPCHTLNEGFIGEWVEFTRSEGGIVESFTIPGDEYGVVYTREQE